jgi:hypothetical protein
MECFIITRMRPISVLIVLVIALSIMATGASFHPAGDTGTPAWKTLDVCHSSSVAADSDVPYISACPYTPLPLQVAGILKPSRLIASQPELVLKDERPPESLS